MSGLRPQTEFEMGPIWPRFSALILHVYGEIYTAAHTCEMVSPWGIEFFEGSDMAKEILKQTSFGKAFKSSDSAIKTY